MKTIVIVTSDSVIVRIPQAHELSYEALTARVRRAEKKAGRKVQCLGEGIYGAGTAAALHHHRRSYSDRSGAYQPKRFGKISWLRDFTHSRAARKAGLWLTEKAKALGFCGLPKASSMREKGVPSIAYKLASGACSMKGPVAKLP